VSALDDWLDCDAEHDARCECIRNRTLAELEADPLPPLGPCNCGTEAKREKAQAELDALRRRCEDLELIARASLDAHFDISKRDVEWVIARYDSDEFWHDGGRSAYAKMLDTASVPDDGTGLPRLTPAARNALRGEK
jgi:hypothetical protein